MPREGDQQIDRAVGTSVPEVVQSAAADGIASSTLSAPRAGARRPVAAAPFDAWLGQIFHTGDALGDIRNILAWTSHGLNS